MSSPGIVLNVAAGAVVAISEVWKVCRWGREVGEERLGALKSRSSYDTAVFFGFFGRMMEAAAVSTDAFLLAVRVSWPCLRSCAWSKQRG